MRRAKIAVADDNPAMLEMLVSTLRGKFAIVGAFADGTSLLSSAASLRADIILLDVSLGQMNGLEVAKCLLNAGSDAKIVFFSIHEDDTFIQAAYALGAAGYVFKSRAGADLIPALDNVAHGRVFFPTLLALN